MRLRLVFACILLRQSASACLPVSADRILARDLASAIPAFAALPEQTVLGYSPLPGGVRTFDRRELESIARTHKLLLGPADSVCFFIPLLEHLPELGTVAAMRRVLPANSDLEVLELPKASVPAGEITFPLEGLEPPQPADPTVQSWKGYIMFAGTRRWPVWARVRISIERSVLVARRSLKLGETLAEDAVGMESRRGPLRLEQMAAGPAQAVGRIVLRAVKEGEPIPVAFLDLAAVIHRGEPVKVEVVNGSAHLQLGAIAETNAREGEPVQLRNPTSGKVFRARATGLGRAAIVVGTTLSGRSE